MSFANVLSPPNAPVFHPSGAEKHGPLVQFLRGTALALYFFLSCVIIIVTQLIGLPLYPINRRLFDSYIAVTKGFFAILIITITQWWGPTTIRISGDASVAAQIKAAPNGGVEFLFPERLVMIANHQLYTDWVYLWWVAYANSPHLDGHIYILLKESLKKIPVLGWGMTLYGFIFMSRKMDVDQHRMAYRLNKLKESHVAPDGTRYRDPMWLLLFPEGTNISNNSRVKSSAWATKLGVPDLEHTLLPRSTGTYFCLKQLDSTVEYIYDCTVAYEGIPRGKYGENFFSLQSTYFEGRPPKSVHFYWRRFRVAELPLESPEAFDDWLRQVWIEKDALLDGYLNDGRMPELHGQGGYIETKVQTRVAFEILRLLSIPGTLFLFIYLLRRLQDVMA